MKYLDLTTFRADGFLQEVNRQFFHPRGLALVMSEDDAGVPQLVGIWDARDDLMGIVFDQAILATPEARAKADAVQQAALTHFLHRVAVLGSLIQPIPSE